MALGVVFLIRSSQQIPHDVFASTIHTIQKDYLVIPHLRDANFTGSEIVIEDVLPGGKQYDRYLVSYISEKIKIFGSLLLPTEDPPPDGFPVMLFAHGYIPPEEYDTKTEYAEFFSYFADHGYAVFIPDFRGHGNSEGIAEGAYFSPGYTIDFINALESIKKFKGVNSNKIGVWGHSMGGHIILRTLIYDSSIKGAVIWSGVVGSYIDILYHWPTANVWEETSEKAHKSPRELIAIHGSLNENPGYWQSIDPTFHAQFIQTPLQLHHGRKDTIVPLEFSQKFVEVLKSKGKNIELYEYEFADHDFSEYSRMQALSRSLQFFNTLLQ